jgi:hypothetical protein
LITFELIIENLLLSWKAWIRRWQVFVELSRSGTRYTTICASATNWSVVLLTTRVHHTISIVCGCLRHLKRPHVTVKMTSGAIRSYRCVRFLFFSTIFGAFAKAQDEQQQTYEAKHTDQKEKPNR